jgi:hypothetical protein
MWKRSDMATGAALVLAAALAGCGGAYGRAVGAPEPFLGYFTAERNLFRPCEVVGTDSLWAATFTGYAQQQRQRLAETGALNLPRPVLIRVYADRSRIRTPAPHQLGTTRDLYIREIAETRLAGQCPTVEVSSAGSDDERYTEFG